MMFEVERIEDWKGQDVLGSDGEKVGTLDDVYCELGSGEPVLGEVKSGLISRKRYLVPLEGAKVTRDHVQVTHESGWIEEGPEAPDDGQVDAERERRIADHYDGYEASGEDGVRLEAVASTRERLERAEEEESEAEELRERATERAEEAEKLRAAAEERRQEGEQRATEADELRSKAEELERRATERRNLGKD